MKQYTKDAKYPTGKRLESSRAFPMWRQVSFSTHHFPAKEPIESFPTRFAPVAPERRKHSRVALAGENQSDQNENTFFSRLMKKPDVNLALGKQPRLK